MSQQTNLDATSPSTSDYGRLLAEVAEIKGTSLGRDAWRRLRRNYAAMLFYTDNIAAHDLMRTPLESGAIFCPFR